VQAIEAAQYGRGNEMAKPPVYRIRVQGALDETWSDWLAGMIITVEDRSGCPCIMNLTGPVVDQAALRGILTRLLDLNLELLSVTRVEE
jgi:hypothetical protein